MFESALCDVDRASIELEVKRAEEELDASAFYRFLAVLKDAALRETRARGGPGRCARGFTIPRTIARRTAARGPPCS